jgi:hypothetical protein
MGESQLPYCYATDIINMNTKCQFLIRVKVRLEQSFSAMHKEENSSMYPPIQRHRIQALQKLSMRSLNRISLIQMQSS